MLKVMKTQQDALGIDQGWKGNFIEAGGREIVGILHVSSDNIELDGKQPTFVHVVYLMQLSAAKMHHFHTS